MSFSTLRTYPSRPDCLYVMKAQANGRNPREWRTCLSQRLSTHRTRFIPRGVRSTTHRRAWTPASYVSALASSPRARMWAVKPHAVSSSRTAASSSPVSRPLPWGVSGVGSGRARGRLAMGARARWQSWRFAPSPARPTGTPPPSVSTRRVVPIWPRSVGFWPTCVPPTGRLGHGPLQRAPCPVTPLEGSVCHHAWLPPRQDDVRCGPLWNATRGGAPGTEARLVQRLPRAAGAAHAEDGLQRLPLLDAGPLAPQGGGWRGGSSGSMRAHHTSGRRPSRWGCSWSSCLRAAPRGEPFSLQATIKNSLLG